MAGIGEDISIYGRYCYVCRCVDFAVNPPKHPLEFSGGSVGAPCAKCGHSEVVHAPRTLGALRKPVIRLGNTPPILNWSIVVALPLAIVVLTGLVFPQLPLIARDICAIVVVGLASPLVITIVYYTLKSLFYAVVTFILVAIIGSVGYVVGKALHLW